MELSSNESTFDRNYSLKTNNQPFTYVESPRYQNYLEKFGLRNRKVKYKRLPTEETSFIEESEPSVTEQFEISETAPLLEGTGAVTSGITAGTSTGASAASIVGGTLVAAGILAAANTFNNSRQEGKDGLVLPFSNNIGPGNDIKPPRTNADAIAADHDIAYGLSKDNKHIFDADKKAIGDFAYETIYGSNPVSKLQAGIGSVGLSIKHAVEKGTGGVIYGKYEL